MGPKTILRAARRAAAFSHRIRKSWGAPLEFETFRSNIRFGEKCVGEKKSGLVGIRNCEHGRERHPWLPASTMTVVISGDATKSVPVVFVTLTTHLPRVSCEKHVEPRGKSDRLWPIINFDGVIRCRPKRRRSRKARSVPFAHRRLDFWEGRVLCALPGRVDAACGSEGFVPRSKA